MTSMQATPARANPRAGRGKEPTLADELFVAMVKTWNRWRRRQPFTAEDLRHKPGQPLPEVV
jgi:hypothetical protein